MADHKNPRMSREEALDALFRLSTDAEADIELMNDKERYEQKKTAFYKKETEKLVEELEKGIQ